MRVTWLDAVDCKLCWNCSLELCETNIGGSTSVLLVLQLFWSGVAGLELDKTCLELNWQRVLCVSKLWNNTECVLKNRNQATQTVTNCLVLCVQGYLLYLMARSFKSRKTRMATSRTMVSINGVSVPARTIPISDDDDGDCPIDVSWHTLSASLSSRSIRVCSSSQFTAQQGTNHARGLL